MFKAKNTIVTLFAILFSITFQNCVARSSISNVQSEESLETALQPQNEVVANNQEQNENAKTDNPINFMLRLQNPVWKNPQQRFEDHGKSVEEHFSLGNIEKASALPLLGYNGEEIPIFINPKTGLPDTFELIPQGNGRTPLDPKAGKPFRSKAKETGLGKEKFLMGSVAALCLGTLLCALGVTKVADYHETRYDCYHNYSVKNYCSDSENTIKTCSNDAFPKRYGAYDVAGSEPTSHNSIALRKCSECVHGPLPMTDNMRFDICDIHIEEIRAKDFKNILFFGTPGTSLGLLGLAFVLKRNADGEVAQSLKEVIDGKKALLRNDEIIETIIRLKKRFGFIINPRIIGIFPGLEKSR